MKHEEFLDQPQEEPLERIYVLHERGEETVEGVLRGGNGQNGDAQLLLRALANRRLVTIANDAIHLTETGETRARELVRRNRLAERLLADVLNVSLADAEHTACLLEHVLSPAVTDAVCTLLAHPPTCPHGHPIPPGPCCANRDRTVQALVRSLTDLEPGRRARVAFMTPSVKNRLRKLESMGLIPGAMISLKQKRPTLVVEIEGTTLALEGDVGREIFVRPEE